MTVSTDRAADASASGEAESLVEQTRAFLREYPVATTGRAEFLRARFAAGLAWVNFPTGRGGQGLPRHLQAVVDAELRAAGAPDNNPRRISIGLGMAAPTILEHGTAEQHDRWLRSLWTGEQLWCQLFSEPGAGSDLAALGTRAVRDGDRWIVNGQKVWTSMAHEASWAILLARTNVDAPKHRGITYFACDMTQPGIEVRPIRQATGEAEFNEVFLGDVVIPDEDRIGAVDNGWMIAQTTLNNERVSIGGDSAARESGPVGRLAEVWRSRPELRSAGLHDDLLRLWVEAEALRITNLRTKQLMLAGSPGPDGSATKLAFSSHNQRAAGLLLQLLGEEGLDYDDWTMRRPETVDLVSDRAGYAYLRAKGNSIEGGTSEILRNIIAERVLGLPKEPRTGADLPWKDLPR